MNIRLNVGAATTSFAGYLLKFKLIYGVSDHEPMRKRVHEYE